MPDTKRWSEDLGKQHLYVMITISAENIEIDSD